MRTNRAVRTAMLIVSGWIFGRLAFVGFANDRAGWLGTIANVQREVAAVPIGPSTRASFPGLVPVHVALTRTHRFRGANKKQGAAKLVEQTGHFSQKSSALSLPAADSSAELPSLRETGELLYPQEQVINPQLEKPTAKLVANEDSKSWEMSGSGWILVRPNGKGLGLVDGGQLGGSQGGIRLMLPLNRSGLALQGRFSQALQRESQAEATVGLRYQVVRRSFNIEVSAERRNALTKGGRNAFALGVAGGFYERPLPGKLSLTGYAQLGLIGLHSRDGYVDGSLLLERALPAHFGGSPKIGLGSWVGAQKGSSRIDVGPRVSYKFRLAHAHLAVSADWRQRVAGRSAPGSGPAITIGSDF